MSQIIPQSSSSSPSGPPPISYLGAGPLLRSINWSRVPTANASTYEADAPTNSSSTPSAQRQLASRAQVQQLAYELSPQMAGPQPQQTSQQTSQTTIPIPLSTTAAKGQKAFRPYGSAPQAMYDKSPVVGISGPAGTGKSRLYLEKLHLICEKYPGARVLIARKTRESLSEAALFTLEEKVFPEGHPALDGPRRSHRQQYHYPNGSLIVVCGLDKPQKIMSTEYDIIYIQEATECDKADIDMLSTRLRNGIVPYQQLLFDCNPDKPTHWLYQGALSAVWPLHKSYHEDNPTLWQEAPPDVQHQQSVLPLSSRGTFDWPLVAPDGRVGRYTPHGVEYLRKLDQLTGARYKRLRLGLWVSAEGAVYEEEWDDSSAPFGNLHDPMPYPPLQWRRKWAIDFGYTAPLVFGKFAFDPDGRAYHYYEIYHTHLMVEDACARILADSGWSYDEDNGHKPTRIDPPPDPLPEYIVCDTDAEGVAVVESKTGLRCVRAYKGDEAGIQAVKSRMRKHGDGRPRLYLCRDAVERRDQELKDAAKPQCTIEEIDGFVWDTSPTRRKGERPLKIDDHGMDMLRYLICDEDNVRDDVKAAEVAEAAGAIGPMVVGVRQNREDAYTSRNDPYNPYGHSNANKTFHTERQRDEDDERERRRERERERRDERAQSGSGCDAAWSIGPGGSRRIGHSQGQRGRCEHTSSRRSGRQQGSGWGKSQYAGRERTAA